MNCKKDKKIIYIAVNQIKDTNTCRVLYFNKDNFLQAPFGIAYTITNSDIVSLTKTDIEEGLTFNTLNTALLSFYKDILKKHFNNEVVEELLSYMLVTNEGESIEVNKELLVANANTITEIWGYLEMIMNSYQIPRYLNS